MDFFRFRRSKRTQTDTRDRPSLKDGECHIRPGSFRELNDNSNKTQTNSNEAKKELTYERNS